MTQSSYVKKAEKLLEVIAVYSAAYDFDAVIPVSAKTGDGVDILKEELCRYAIESPALFPENMTTDQPEKQVCAEIIREKLLLCLEREVPHGTAVVIEDFKEEDGLISVRAEIYCEKASHKGIIIGKNGQALKLIGEKNAHELRSCLQSCGAEPEQIERLCRHCLWLEKGKVKMIGDAQEVCRAYRASGE